MSELPTNAGFITTRSGKAIPCALLPETASERMALRAEVLMTQQPELSLRSLSNYPYNCVGMIFAARRAWIELDYIYELLIEDNYQSLSVNQVMTGDLVLYKNQGKASHVALIVAVERSAGPRVQVLSKWGLGPEFIHWQEEVTELMGSPAEYWTDRPL